MVELPLFYLFSIFFSKTHEKSIFFKLANTAAQPQILSLSNSIFVKTQSKREDSEINNVPNFFFLPWLINFVSVQLLLLFSFDCIFLQQKQVSNLFVRRDQRNVEGKGNLPPIQDL
eukprot:TRINITY_DN6581_c1_g1_i1.p3 TRINITY_DN6581_c1_g1~~TRINITY_DN6581_c1_g1_i1.p3  ORF type:complete len:116 (-),score=9.37 TRINITY_DN6581_c1_g1_i1:618-965(-)